MKFINSQPWKLQPLTFGNRLEISSHFLLLIHVENKSNLCYWKDNLIIKYRTILDWLGVPFVIFRFEIITWSFLNFRFRIWTSENAHQPHPWASCQIRKIVSDPDMHHGTCVTHVPWCMPGSLTSGYIWTRLREKSSRHSRRMRKPQFSVSGKRPISVTCGIKRVGVGGGGAGVIYLRLDR